MPDSLTDADLDEIQARVDAATEGQWRVDDEGDIVAPPPPSAPSWQDREWMVEGDGGRSAVSQIDARFIAAARTDVPRLLAEVRALREEVRNLSEALGFGNGIEEPSATLPALIDPLQDALHEATEHAECPIWCALCGERLADTRCKHCQGSGCGPGTASGAYEECEWCAGAGKIHPGCVEMSYADMAAAIRKYEEEGNEL